MTSLPIVPRVEAPALPLTRARAVLLIEALAGHEERLDTMGCVRDVQLTRTMLLELRRLAMGLTDA